MEVPGLGEIKKDDQLGWLISKPVPVPVLGGKSCRFVLAGYVDDPRKGDFHTAIANFLSASPSVLRAAEPHVFRYYEDSVEEFGPDAEMGVIDSPSDVWDYLEFGDDLIVERRSGGDKAIYISLECECGWEEEHGLQIVFQNGLKVNKVGPYDGHLTNADAYDAEAYENVIYVSPLD